MGRHGSEGRRSAATPFALDITLKTSYTSYIVLKTHSIRQAERMLTKFDETCGCIGLQLNLQKTMFMRNGWV
ncbi:hypothetical protein RB195_011595 [Necator americanus]|uniref:Reverse transcriptase domain-containing protein n=1 Tax=Necator americanus TaxID=51031 RepID=A0ABR1D392_NECAM